MSECKPLAAGASPDTIANAMLEGLAMGTMRLGHTLEGLEEREVRDAAGRETAGSGVVLTFATPRSEPADFARHVVDAVWYPRALSRMASYAVASSIRCQALLHGREGPRPHRCWREGAWLAPTAGNTLAHFSAQPEPFLTQNAP